VKQQPAHSVYVADMKKELKACRTKEFSAHNSKAHSVAWSCNGKHIASGSLDKTACILSMKEDRLSREFSLKGHEDGVDQLSWHPTDPNILASASADKTLRLWDIRTQKSVGCVTTKGEIINMTWRGDGSALAIGNKDDVVSIIDYKSQKVTNEKKFDFEVNELAWNHDLSLFFLTSGNGSVYILDYPSLDQVIMSLPAHTAHCICLKFSPDKEHFATGGADALISIWDAKELACLRSYSRLEWPIRTLSFNYDGQMIATGSEDLVIDISMVHTGEKIHTISCNAFPFCVAWHPSKNVLAYVTDDKSKHGESKHRDGDRDLGNVKLFGV